LIVRSILEVAGSVEELRRAVRQGVDGHRDAIRGIELVLGEVAAGIERSGQVAGGIVERRGPVAQGIDGEPPTMSCAAPVGLSYCPPR
jgi:hypothetical protein